MTIQKPANVKVVRFACSSKDKQNVAVIESSGPMSSELEAEELAFQEYFSNEVSALLRKFSERFPYRHSIKWSMKVGDQCQHDLDIEVKPPESTNIA